ncbi:MAG TPA: O-methyltransferase [Actinomycetales bacterium]|nr:O-methyltransferase [Actinomycetales bacterium]
MVRNPAHETWEVVISDKALSWAFCEEFTDPDEAILKAQQLSEELGCPVISPGAGSVLQVLAAAAGARAVVEIGTGAGVSALWLLRGMPADGVLTSIDVNVEHQQAARKLLTEEGITSGRVRMIGGNAINVLPRLADGAYDLIFLDADPLDYLEQFELSAQLLRPGGLMVINEALWHDRVADPARRDETTTAVREIGRVLRDDERFKSALLPVSGGLLIGVRA